MAYGLHNMQRALCPGYQVGTALMDECRDTLGQSKEIKEGDERGEGGIVGQKEGTSCHISLDLVAMEAIFDLLSYYKHFIGKSARWEPEWSHT